MSDPHISQKAPYVIEEEPREIHWCSCGRSSNQPYCDGSHQGTDFQPVTVTIAKKEKVAWCGCRHTSNPPYCDGSHAKL
ncbi:MAG: hypothetical protein IEMM0008_1173 [bacterium]|nr:MAG: hypothetical protein IEMM0008_1173 [bacterium]